MINVNPENVNKSLDNIEYCLSLITVHLENLKRVAQSGDLPDKINPTEVELWRRQTLKTLKM